MGTYINIGNSGFQSARRHEYIDKSGLIPIINGTLFSEWRYSCVTRCRRFGKSMAARMLCAYYDHSCQSRSLFADLSVSSDPSFEEHLNRYPVIYIDMTDFTTRFRDSSIVRRLDASVRKDMLEAYPDVPGRDDDDLMEYLIRVVQQSGNPFIFIIDEWDAICREFTRGTKVIDEYVDWLRRMFKGVNGNRVFAGVYMTGILPIKKYKTESALNNFIEYSMVNPKQLSPFFGFTKDEVRGLAERHGTNFDELKKWYDGYQIGNMPSMFNPNSVMQAVTSNWFQSYWATTGAYEAVVSYIQMNYEGLKDDILRMLAGERCHVDSTGFLNDISDVRSRDDVLTLLIHLGYLSYDWREQECYIPNYEVAGEMVNAVKETSWSFVAEALQQSRSLLTSTLAGDAEAVAQALERVHGEQTSVLSYNNENSLACALSIAYYYAHGDYIFHRELPTGKGFADIVLIPRKNVAKPAIVLELKYDQTADAAIDQILRRQYPVKIKEYTGHILLVGINYDRQTKTHSCRIQYIRR